MNSKAQEEYLDERGVTGHDLEMCEITNLEDMKKLRTAFRLKFPCLMANIVRILLYQKEEKLACLLTAYYEISLEKKMILYAIECQHFQWLNFVFVFGKNWFGVRRFPMEVEAKSGQKETDNENKTK